MPLRLGKPYNTWNQSLCDGRQFETPFLGTAPHPSEPLSGDRVVQVKVSLYDTMANRTDLSEFVRLIDAVGLRENYFKTGPFTVFAPNNDAFASMNACDLLAFTAITAPKNEDGTVDVDQLTLATQEQKDALAALSASDVVLLSQQGEAFVRQHTFDGELSTRQIALPITNAVPSVDVAEGANPPIGKIAFFVLNATDSLFPKLFSSGDSSILFTQPEDPLTRVANDPGLPRSQNNEALNGLVHVLNGFINPLWPEDLPTTCPFRETA